MPDTTRFKFRYLDRKGKEVGFLSQSGVFDGETLTLGSEAVPATTILRADNRFNRLALTIQQEGADPTTLAFVVKKGRISRIVQALNAASSMRRAVARKQELEKQGKGDLFAIVACPYCDATVDMTDFDDTKQFYCHYCETIVTRDDNAPKDESQYHLCDACGYFSKPRPFTILYFYFLIFIWGFRSRRHFMCPACTRAEAWKMIFCNLPFLLGFPRALYQLIRVCAADRGDPAASYAGIYKANRLAHKRKTRKAVDLYDQMSTMFMDSAGIRFNAGRAFRKTAKHEAAIEQFHRALSLCSNHAPSLKALIASYRALGQTEQADALQQSCDACPTFPMNRVLTTKHARGSS